MKLLVVGEKTSAPEGLHNFITRRLHFALGRFAPEVERVTARVEDVNGPRGGMDKRCRMDVKLRGMGNVPGEACADDFEAAVAFAAERVGSGVVRALERRRHRTRRSLGMSVAGLRELAKNGKRLKKSDTPAIEIEPEGL